MKSSILRSVWSINEKQEKAVCMEEIGAMKVKEASNKLIVFYYFTYKNLFIAIIWCNLRGKKRIDKQI